MISIQRKYDLILLCLLASLLMRPSPCHAGLGLKDIVAGLEGRYRTIEDITAVFTQQTNSRSQGSTIKARGTVFFKRPEKMRWDYLTPESQLIVTSGDKVYVYEREAEQVMVISRKQFLNNSISRAFFCGEGKIDQIFRVEPLKTQGEEAPPGLHLVPLDEEAGVESIDLIVDPRSFIIRQMWITDRLGNRTHLIFSNLKINSGLSDRLFRFTIPQGVQVYRTNQ